MPLSSTHRTLTRSLITFSIRFSSPLQTTLTLKTVYDEMNFLKKWRGCFNKHAIWGSCLMCVRWPVLTALAKTGLVNVQKCLLFGNQHLKGWPMLLNNLIDKSKLKELFYSGNPSFGQTISGNTTKTLNFFASTF